MPRTIEHLVETHRRANALRNAGKPIWDKNIPIGSILRERDEKTPELLVDVATRIAATLRGRLPASYFDITHEDYDMDIDEVVEDFESYSLDGLRDLDNEGEDVFEMFDGRLEELYDWADMNRVWISG